MLIVTMTRKTGWWRNLLGAMPRFVLAMVIGAIISEPLVLRVFEPEINAELQVIHAENAAEFQQRLDRQFADIPQLQVEVDKLQAAASGSSRPSVSADPDVVAAQKNVDLAQTAYNTAITRVQCEIDGTCGSRAAGVGAATRQAQAVADQAARNLQDAQGRLNVTTAAAEALITQSARATMAAAQEQLNYLQPQLKIRQDQLAEVRNTQMSAEATNSGLLARIEALGQLSTSHATVTLMTSLIILLFLTIEVLPVAAKLLSMSGPETLYEAVLDDEEANMRERSSQHEAAVTQLEHDRTDEEVRQASEALKILWERKSEAVKRVIDEYSDDELIRSLLKAIHADPDRAGGRTPRKSA